MCLRPLVIKNPNYMNESTAPSHIYANSRNVYGRTMTVPCGTCIECARNRANQLGWLAQQEILSCPTRQASFVTFTYNDAHLPRVRFTYTKTHKDTGEVELLNSELPTVENEFFQKVLKRIRYEFSKSHNIPLRVLWCSEYGTHRHRPHYHALFIGMSPLEASIICNKVWTEPNPDPNGTRVSLGFVYVDSKNAGFGSAKYVAKYSCKPSNLDDDDDVFKLSKYERTFCKTRRNPCAPIQKPIARHSLRFGFSYLYNSDGTIKQDVIDRHHATRTLSDGTKSLDNRIVLGIARTGQPIYGNLPTILAHKIYTSQDLYQLYQSRINEQNYKLFKQLCTYVNKTELAYSVENLNRLLTECNLASFFASLEQDEKISARQSYNRFIQDYQTDLF